MRADAFEASELPLPGAATMEGLLGSADVSVAPSPDVSNGPSWDVPVAPHPSIVTNGGTFVDATLRSVAPVLVELSGVGDESDTVMLSFCALLELPKRRLRFGLDLL
jgi:hypothetical protein